MLHRYCNLLPRTSLKSGQIQVTHVEVVILLNRAIWLLRRMTSPVLELVFAESLPILTLERQWWMALHSWPTGRVQTSSMVRSAVAMMAWTKTKP